MSALAEMGVAVNETIFALPIDVVAGMIEGHKAYAERRKMRRMTPEAKAKAKRIIAAVMGV